MELSMPPSAVSNITSEEKMVTVLSGVHSLSLGFPASLLELSLQLMVTDNMEMDVTCNTGGAAQIKLQRTKDDMILFNVDTDVHQSLLENCEDPCWKCHFGKIDGPVYHYTQTSSSTNEVFNHGVEDGESLLQISSIPQGSVEDDRNIDCPQVLNIGDSSEITSDHLANSKKEEICCKVKIVEPSAASTVYVDPTECSHVIIQNPEDLNHSQIVNDLPNFANRQKTNVAKTEDIERIHNDGDDLPVEIENENILLDTENEQIPEMSSSNMLTPWAYSTQSNNITCIEAEPVSLMDGDSTPILHLDDAQNTSITAGSEAQTIIAVKGDDGSMQHFTVADLTSGALPIISIKTDQEVEYREEAGVDMSNQQVDGEEDVSQVTTVNALLELPIRGRQKLVLDPEEADGMPTRKVPRIVKDVMVYLCYCCKKRYTKLQNLQTHIGRVHRQEYDSKQIKTEMMLNSHVCFICNQIYPDYHSLYKHLKRVHKTGEAFRTNNKAGDPGVETVQCIICDKAFIRYHTIINHIKKSHKGHPEAQKALYHVDDIRYQRRSKKSRIVNLCPYCDEQFHGIEIYKHMKRYHINESDYKGKLKILRKDYNSKLKPFLDQSSFEKVICFKCGAEVMKRNLARHGETACGKIFDGGSKTSCPKCKKMIVKKGMKNHLKYKCLENLSKSEWICEYCGKVFNLPTPYEKHVREEHRAKDGTKRVNKRLSEWRYCEICKQELHVQWLGMRQHKRTQHNIKYDDDSLEQEVVCSTCGEVIVGGLDNLTSHKKKVHKEKVIVCELCNSEISGGSPALVAHKRSVHNIVYEVCKCQLCDKVFPHKNSLKWHMNSVHSERKFICNECGKGFKLIYTMREHIKTIHKKQYPLNCDYCGQGFQRIKTLQRHMEICEKYNVNIKTEIQEEIENMAENEKLGKEGVVVDLKHPQKIATKKRKLCNESSDVMVKREEDISFDQNNKSVFDSMLSLIASSEDQNASTTDVVTYSGLSESLQMNPPQDISLNDTTDEIYHTITHVSHVTDTNTPPENYMCMDNEEIIHKSNEERPGHPTINLKIEIAASNSGESFAPVITKRVRVKRSKAHSQIDKTVCLPNDICGDVVQDYDSLNCQKLILKRDRKVPQSVGLSEELSNCVPRKSHRSNAVVPSKHTSNKLSHTVAISNDAATKIPRKQNQNNLETSKYGKSINFTPESSISLQTKSADAKNPVKNIIYSQHTVPGSRVSSRLSSKRKHLSDG